MAVLERPRPRPDQYEKQHWHRRLTPEVRESLAVFAAVAVPYAILGWHLVLVQHVVVEDAVTRLSHAYDVWWNSPPKLAAVGFTWPPIATFVFLPLALIRPVATSLLALPLTTSFFAGLLFVFLNGTLRLFALRRPLRFLLLALFAANPMILFYGTNGMSEVVYLALLMGGVYFFVRWFQERRAVTLALVAMFFALGILSRYEVFAWAAVLTVALAATLIRRRVPRDELEGTLITYLAPIVYGVGLWLFFNFLILRDALFWLRHQTPTAGQGPLSAAQATAASIGTHHHLTVLHVARTLVALNWHLFPLTIPVFCALLVLFVARRDWIALTFAVFIGLNAVVSLLLIWSSQAEIYGQLRYNMRAMPLALAGAGWLISRFRGRARLTLAFVTVLVAAGSMVSTWRTMETYKPQYHEAAFIRAISTGADVKGLRIKSRFPIGLGPERRVAAYLRAHKHARNSILTDDAQTYAVMLLTGHPDWFVDRIDKGDDYWLSVRDAPRGKVQYVLASWDAADLVRLRYPRLFGGSEPGFAVVFDDRKYVLARVLPTRR